MRNRLRSVDLNLLKVFDVVMIERNITRAAARLCVSQPAISNALGRLRALHEDELFVRGPRGVVPTARANEIAASVREALRLIEATLAGGDDFRPETSRRTFTVALTDYGEYYFLPRLMGRLVAEAPGIDVVCLPHPGATLMPEMKSGAVDGVWDWLRIDDPDYACEQVFADRSYCVARRGHPQFEVPLTLDRFVELEHIALRATRTHVPMVDRRLEALGLVRKVVTEVSHLLAMPGIVASTSLVACLPERLARLFAAQMDLQIAPNPVFDDAVPVYQMWHRSAGRDPGHAWFRALLADIARAG